MKHCGTQVIETERLILRRFSIDDAEAMYRNWASDPKLSGEEETIEERSCPENKFRAAPLSVIIYSPWISISTAYQVPPDLTKTSVYTLLMSLVS